MLDMGIVLFSLISAFFLRFNFNIPENEYAQFPLVFSAVLAIRAFTFYLAKSYRGIVRYTSLNDFQRIFLAVSSGTIAIAFLNLIRFFIIDGIFIVPFSILIIEFLLVFFLMGSLRIGVKMIYHEIVNSTTEKCDVVIYGAGDNGVTTKRALDRVQDKKYNVVAFIDINPQKVGKSIEGVKIYSESHIQKFLAIKTVTSLVIAVQNLPREKKNWLTDIALASKVKPLTVPPVTAWINGEINAKQIRDLKIEDLLGRKEIKLDLKKIANDLEGKTILISGAAGSIGSGIVRQVAKFNPKKILLLDQAESPMYELELEVKKDFAFADTEVIIGDIRDKKRMRRLFGVLKPEIVFHAAAYKHVPLMEDNPSEAIRTNILGTKNLADLSDEFKIEKFVMISTDKAVNPTNVMGASKRIAEVYCQSINKQSHTKFITTRFGNVLGSNGSVIPLFRKQIDNGGPITVTHPDITRFFMTIPEACQLVLEAGTMGKGGEIFIFDMGESVKIVDLAKKMIRLSGLEEGKDIEIVFSGLRPGEKLYEELLANEENTIKTHHPQIMIGKVREYGFKEVNNKITEIIGLYQTQDNFAIVKAMKDIVPEFLSKNSVYSELDRH